MDTNNINELLSFMVQRAISDIHLKADAVPLIRFNGHILSTGLPALSAETICSIANHFMTDIQRHRFEKDGEIDLTYALPKVSRFRVNVYRQKGTLALSLRVIPLTAKSFEDLHLPVETLQRLCALQSGLVLMAGITGAGKTTTLNSMVNYINKTGAYNIITVEDPIEFYHQDAKSSISQREIGTDTQTFGTALKYILRQDPDVVVIGEMRDPETIFAAVTAAETGHLVLSTLHTMDAIHTIHRIIDSYPAPQQPQVRMSLANILRAVVAQKLLPTADGQGQHPCVEILLVTPFIRQLILDGKIAEIYPAMTRSANEGMATFDQSLVKLCKEGLILQETAVASSLWPENLVSILQGIAVKL